MKNILNQKWTVVLWIITGINFYLQYEAQHNDLGILLFSGLTFCAMSGLIVLTVLLGK